MNKPEQNNAPQNEPSPSNPAPPLPFTGFDKRAQGYLKDLPALLTHLVKNPTQFPATLTVTDTWERPFVYALASGLTAGAVTAATFGVWLHVVALAAVLNAIFNAIGVVFVGGFLLSFALGTFAGGKDPGHYRTTLLVSLLGFLNIANGLLAFVGSWVTLLPIGYCCFILFHYAQAAASWKRQPALYLAWGLFVIYTLGIVLNSLRHPLLP